MHRKSRVKIRWTRDFAYAIGLITSDGNLSPDGRHINLTSKDEEIVLLFRSILKLKNIIGKKSRSSSKEKRYFVIQFGDINFYEFLVSIGLHPAKSKTLKKVTVPRKFFPDFLRGCIDGDGNINSFRHPESKHTQYRIRLCSASISFLEWIHLAVRKAVKIDGGYIYSQQGKSVSMLCFATQDAKKILSFMYHDSKVPSLTRKRKLAMEIIGQMA